MTTKAIVPKTEMPIQAYDPAEIRRLLIPGNQPQPTKEEVDYFVRVCLEAELNPFLKEIFLVKTSDNFPASIIPAAIAYEQRAEDFPEFDGYQAGLLILSDTHSVIERPGTLVLPGEKMGVHVVGGYARIKRKDRSEPYYLSVGYWESLVTTREGKPNRFWEKQPGYQLRLSALRKCLREAFPKRYPEAVFGHGQDYDTFESNVPPESFRGSKELRWKAFYGKLSEMGVSHERAQEIIEEATGEGCASLQVWVNTHEGGLERLYEIIVNHVRKQANAKDKDDLYGNQQEIESQIKADQQSSEPARPEVMPTDQAGPPFHSQGPETSPSQTAPTDSKPTPALGTLTRAETWQHVKTMMPYSRATFEIIADWCRKQNIAVTVAELTKPEPPAIVTDDMISRIVDIFQSRLDDARKLTQEGK